MVLRIYNSLSGKKERFVPVNVETGEVKMYVCGMTVYSDAHIGHARTYLAFDIIRKYLKYRRYKVTYIQNITDVDDKIIAAANKKEKDPLQYSKEFADKCLSALDDLGIERADRYPKASETIEDMKDMIQDIIKNKYAYIEKGDVYFSVEKFKDYGALSGQRIGGMKSGARINPGDKKHSPLDFALWKEAKPGELYWDSPWGKGRPGWHIECSAMSSKLGIPFDIHGGGMDLKFPHHENEIAQAVAATGKQQFAKYWMHIGLLTVDGEKMSKSIGNIINIQDLLKRWDAEVVRMFFAQAHYRSPPDFSEKALLDVKKGLDRIYRLKEKLEKLAKNSNDVTIDENKLTAEEKKYLIVLDDFKAEFESAMDDDFNTPKAFAAFFDFVNASNRFLETNDSVDPTLCHHALDMFVKLGNVLTLFQPKKDQADDDSLLKELQMLLSKYSPSTDINDCDEVVKTLLNIREDARKQKDWKTADEIRKKLEEIGYEIQDTESGAVWRRK